MTSHPHFLSLPAEIHEKIWDAVALHPDSLITSPLQHSDLLINKTCYSFSLRSYYTFGQIPLSGTKTGWEKFEESLPGEFRVLISRVSITFLPSDGNLSGMISSLLKKLIAELPHLTHLRITQAFNSSTSRIYENHLPHLLEWWSNTKSFLTVPNDSVHMLAFVRIGAIADFHHWDMSSSSDWVHIGNELGLWNGSIREPPGVWMPVLRVLVQMTMRNEMERPWMLLWEMSESLERMWEFEERYGRIFSAKIPLGSRMEKVAETHLKALKGMVEELEFDLY